jgi:CPA1 family monovalent cation:H+ antiporter
MFIFEVMISLLLVGAVLSLWAERVGVPYPALLALAGAGLALIPGMPEVALDPELALALFVAPVLLDAAFDASPRDLKHNLAPVVSLALGAVAISTAAVALIAHWMIPQMGWAAAIALGAIVSPPDASAATAVLRRLGLPHRLTVILEGESLFNDASALLIYRFAVVAALTGEFSGWSVVPMLIVTAGGSVAAGILLARFYLKFIARVHHVSISIMLQFISTFAVWILADRVGLSAIIAVVCYAMTLARMVPAEIDARRRIVSYAVWEVVVFVLNVLAFVLVGLQLRGIVSRLEPGQWPAYITFAAAVCAAVILTRIGWWMSHSTISRWRIRRSGKPLPHGALRPTTGSALIISWCGMRGIVTIAAALALPGNFPFRDLIVLCAFSVLLATLVGQGLTLRWLVSHIEIPDDGMVEREIGLARAETARVALRNLDDSHSTPTSGLRRDYKARLNSGEQQSTGAQPDDSPPVATLQRRMVEAQRQVLIEMRARDEIGDAAFQSAQEELDLLELTADPRVRSS